MSNRTRSQQQKDKVAGVLAFGVLNVFLLRIDAKYWAYTLAVLFVLFAVASLPVWGSLAGLKDARKQQRDLFDWLLFAGLVGAAVLSGLHVLVTTALMLGAFFRQRKGKGFADMREYMPGPAIAIEAVSLLILLAAACWLTLDAGQGRTATEAAMWFAGLAVLFPATLIMGWVWNIFGVAVEANKAVTDRIKGSLDEAGVATTAANIAQVRKTSSDRVAGIKVRLAEAGIAPTAANIAEACRASGDRIAQTEHEEATKRVINVELMHAALGKGALVSLALPALLPALFMLGPIALTGAAYPAWLYVASKTQRPARVDDLVRGIRVR